MTRWLIAVGLGLAQAPAIHAQDGLRSASLPERPIATPPPGPADLFRATPNTYRPRTRPIPPPLPRDGRGTGPVRPAHPISGIDGSRGWLHAGWGYWPYYPEPLDAQPARVEPEVPVAGRLQLRVAPGDARVFIDGGYEGSADDLREPGVLLPLGSHRVRLEANGYTSQTFDVRIDDESTVIRRAMLDQAAVPARSGRNEVEAPRPAPQNVKTMYVIPRCYAGDKPPDPATRCDLTQLRTIR
jgi:hypothetical protein